MRLLLHICCGPCAVETIRLLTQARYRVTGYFDNPNIHPVTEYLQRRQAACHVAAAAGVELLFPHQANEYDALAWCGQALAAGGQGQARCRFCWSSRLQRTALLARHMGFAAFSTSLLYSRHQDHQAIRQAGEQAAAQAGGRAGELSGRTGDLSAPAADAATAPIFYYQDFRTSWQQGIDRSHQLGLYRQKYCGCLFSEQERYAKKLHRLSGPV